MDNPDAVDPCTNIPSSAFCSDDSSAIQFYDDSGNPVTCTCPDQYVCVQDSDTWLVSCGAY
jgi:hypothetical protein